MISIFNFLYEFNDSAHMNKFKKIIGSEDSFDDSANKTVSNLSRALAIPRGYATAADKATTGGVAATFNRPEISDAPSKNEQIKQRTAAVSGFNKMFGEKILKQQGKS